MATASVLSPQGQTGTIPAENLPQAVQRGFKLLNPASGQYEQGVAVTDKDGNGGYLPLGQVNDATKNRGFRIGQPAAIKEESKQPGILGTIVRELPLGIASGTPLGESTHAADYSLIPGLKQEIAHPINSLGLITDSMANAQQRTNDEANAAFKNARDLVTDKNVPLGQRLLGAGEAGYEGLVKKAGALIPLIGPAAISGGEEIGSGIKNRDLAQTVHGVGNAIGQVGMLGMGTPEGEAATEAIVHNTAKPVIAAARGSAQLAKAAKTSLAPLDSLSAEQLVTKATKPRNSINDFPTKLQTALPDAKRAAVASGQPVQNIDDAINAVTKAKQDVWNEYQSRLGPNANLTVSGDPVAAKLQDRLDGMTNIAKKQNPGLVQQIENLRDAYQGQQIPLGDVEARIQELNNELGSIQAKTKVSKVDAMRDPGNAYKFDELSTLKDSLNSELDNITGPGTAELKQRYGNLKSLEDVLYRRKNVAERAAPASLNEQISRARSAGNIVKGAGKVLTMQPSGLADIAGGVADYAAARAGKQLNNSNLLIQKAFEKTNPSAPGKPYVAPPASPFIQQAVNASGRQLPAGQYQAPSSSYQAFQDILSGKGAPRQLNAPNIPSIDARVREAGPSMLEQILQPRAPQLQKAPTAPASRQLPAARAIPLGPSGTSGATNIEPVGLPFIRGNGVTAPEGEAVANAITKGAQPKQFEQPKTSAAIPQTQAAGTTPDEFLQLLNKSVSNVKRDAGLDEVIARQGFVPRGFDPASGQYAFEVPTRNGGLTQKLLPPDQITPENLKALKSNGKGPKPQPKTAPPNREEQAMATRARISQLRNDLFRSTDPTERAEIQQTIQQLSEQLPPRNPLPRVSAPERRAR